MRERVSTGFDSKRGLGAVYGVPALAGTVLSLDDGSKHWQLPGEAASDRLKPGLHTLCPPFASEICGLERLCWHRSASRHHHPGGRPCQSERRIYPAGRRTALGLPDESGVPVVVSGSAHWHRESLRCQGALALTDDLLDLRLQPSQCATPNPAASSGGVALVPIVN